MTELIEGEVIEAEPIRTVVVAQPGQALVSAETPTGPAEMISKAAALADALAAMVTKQKLYTEIRGKKYPHVEAWQTIGRMDNVVARESRAPIRHEDGSYEAFVELVRLSDGMVIGAGSALCGTKDDTNGRQDWSKVSEPSRRSMAVTRATSRAFRAQYAWIMALAGYEPTPADEMPFDDTPAPPMRPPLTPRAEGLIGEVKVGAPPVDMNLRQTTDGPVYGFKLMAGRKGFQCVAEGALADVLAIAVPPLAEGDTVTVFGSVESVPWDKDGKQMPPYTRVHLERVKGPEWTLPAEEGLPEPPDDVSLAGERADAA